MENEILVKLILQNNRLVIPGFGAFLKKDASISSNNIAFSPFLKIDDGILRQAIAQDLSISQDDAKSVIAEIVTQIRAVLAQKGKYYLDEVGVLTLDSNGTIALIPGSMKVKSASVAEVINAPEPVVVPSSFDSNVAGGSSIVANATSAVVSDAGSLSSASESIQSPLQQSSMPYGQPLQSSQSMPQQSSYGQASQLSPQQPLQQSLHGQALPQSHSVMQPGQQQSPQPLQQSLQPQSYSQPVQQQSPQPLQQSPHPQSYSQPVQQQPPQPLQQSIQSPSEQSSVQYGQQSQQPFGQRQPSQQQGQRPLNVPRPMQQRPIQSVRQQTPGATPSGRIMPSQQQQATQPAQSRDAAMGAAGMRRPTPPGAMSSPQGPIIPPVNGANAGRRPGQQPPRRKGPSGKRNKVKQQTDIWLLVAIVAAVIVIILIVYGYLNTGNEIVLDPKTLIEDTTSVVVIPSN